MKFVLLVVATNKVRLKNRRNKHYYKNYQQDATKPLPDPIFQSKDSKVIIRDTDIALLLKIMRVNEVAIAFACNKKTFAIAIFSLPLSLRCFWTDWQKLFSCFSPIAASSACGQA